MWQMWTRRQGRRKRRKRWRRGRCDPSLNKCRVATSGHDFSGSTPLPAPLALVNAETLNLVRPMCLPSRRHMRISSGFATPTCPLLFVYMRLCVYMCELLGSRVTQGGGSSKAVAGVALKAIAENATSENQ